MLLATVSLAVASDYFQKLTADGKSVCNHRAFHTVFLKCVQEVLCEMFCCFWYNHRGSGFYNDA